METGILQRERERKIKSVPCGNSQRILANIKLNLDLPRGYVTFARL